eukprot:2825876-Prorocentrum_lima.AAC.1
MAHGTIGRRAHGKEGPGTKHAKHSPEGLASLGPTTMHNIQMGIRVHSHQLHVDQDMIPLRGKEFDCTAEPDPSQ